MQPRPRPISGKAPEVHGDDVVGDLRRAIGLRVEGGAHVQLHPR